MLRWTVWARDQITQWKSTKDPGDWPTESVRAVLAERACVPTFAESLLAFPAVALLAACGSSGSSATVTSGATRPSSTGGSASSHGAMNSPATSSTATDGGASRKHDPTAGGTVKATITACAATHGPFFHALVKLTNTSAEAHNYVIDVDLTVGGQTKDAANAVAKNVAPGATITVEGLTMTAPAKAQCKIKDITASKASS